MEPVDDPERMLTLAYAPLRSRAALGLLYAIDVRLASTWATPREPGLTAIRLAWWRDAFAALDHGGGIAEPMLADAARLLLSAGVSGAMLARIAEGWLAALEPDDAAALDRHAKLRGGGLFEAAAVLLGGPAADVAEAGAGWALVDLAFRQADPVRARGILARARFGSIGRWPSRLRPLGMLAVLARRDAGRGVAERRQGAPLRIARIAWHRLTGR